MIKMEPHRFLDIQGDGNWQVVFKDATNVDFARITFPGTYNWDELHHAAHNWAQAEEANFARRGHPVTLHAVVEKW